MPGKEIEIRHIDPDILTAIVAMAVVLVVYNMLLRVAESPITTRLAPVEALAPTESAATAGVVPGALPAAEQRLHIEIQPKGPCWISAVADGRPMIARLLQAGERVTVAARDKLVLRVGDPATFAYTLNGVSGRPVGEAQQPVTVVITSNNYQTFLLPLRPGPDEGADIGLPCDPMDSVHALLDQVIDPCENKTAQKPVEERPDPSVQTADKREAVPPIHAPEPDRIGIRSVQRNDPPRQERKTRAPNKRAGQANALTSIFILTSSSLRDRKSNAAGSEGPQHRSWCDCSVQSPRETISSGGRSRSR
jgi:hypothetical protein